MNFNMEMLLEMADRFGFVVDVRGAWPIMIQGMRTLEYRTHRDALHFIAVDSLTQKRIV
jgi:hypothetical protein